MVTCNFDNPNKALSCLAKAKLKSFYYQTLHCWKYCDDLWKESLLV